MSNTIYGIDSQVYKWLSAQDKEAVRLQYEKTHPDEPADPPEITNTPTEDGGKQIRPQDAKTPQEAVNAIRSLRPPDTSDLQNLPQPVRDQIYKQRVAAFNEARQEAAEKVLERLEPKLTDYKQGGINGRTATQDYMDSKAAFNNDPYVRELRRIVTEAKDQPTELPSYLTTQQNGNPQQLSLPQLRDTLGKLGVNLPVNASPQQIQAGYKILGTVPPDIMGKLINPGMQVSFNQPLPGKGTTEHIPLRGQMNLALEGEVELSNVYTGPDLQQTQNLEMSVELRGETGLDFGKTPLQKRYGWASLLRQVPADVKEMVDSSKILSAVVKGSRVSGEYKEMSGVRLKYEAVVTPEQGKKIADGNMSGAPNPLDPLNMPNGTSVLIRGQSLKGSSFQAAYSWFGGASGKNASLDGMGFGVRRLEGSQVEVYSGPVKTVESGLFLGVGRPGKLALGVSAEHSLEHQSMSTARIDLSTKEGRDAYQQFMSTGQIPNWNPPGVQQAGQSSIFTSEHSLRVGVDVGGASLGWGDESQTTISRTNWQDGTIEQKNTYVDGSNHAAEITFKVGPNGKPIDSETSYRLVFGEYDPTLTRYLNGAFTPGKDMQSFKGDQDVQLTFTTGQLMQIREQARTALSSTEHGRDLLKKIDAGTAGASGLQQMLAVAKTPDDVFRLLSNPLNKEKLSEILVNMELQTDQTVGGQIDIRPA